MVKQVCEVLPNFGNHDIGDPLPDNDLIEIIDNAKPIQYNQYMLQNNYDPYQDSLEEECQDQELP